MENTKTTLFDSVKENWQVVMVIVSIIFSWAYFQFTLSTLSARVTSVENKAVVIDGISGDIKGINAKLDIILKKVEL
jgi:hypothetical protein